MLIGLIADTHGYLDPRVPPALKGVDLILHAGDSFLIPSRTPHNALDVGPETGMMLSTYIVEVGQPLATFTS